MQVLKEQLLKEFAQEKILFITSKMWVQDMKNYETAKRAIDASIEKSGLGYLRFINLLHSSNGRLF